MWKAPLLLKPHLKQDAVVGDDALDAPQAQVDDDPIGGHAVRLAGLRGARTAVRVQWASILAPTSRGARFVA